MLLQAEKHDWSDCAEEYTDLNLCYTQMQKMFLMQDGLSVKIEKTFQDVPTCHELLHEFPLSCFLHIDINGCNMLNSTISKMDFPIQIDKLRIGIYIIYFEGFFNYGSCITRLWHFG